MTREEMESLNVGDIVRHADPSHIGRQQYIVTGNYGGRVTAVKTIDIMNPSEWVVIDRVKTRELIVYA